VPRPELEEVVVVVVVVVRRRRRVRGDFGGGLRW
jgi:hypothetical protein